MLRKVSSRQFLRAYLLFEALQGQELIDNLGELVEEDLQDVYSEHGGLVCFDDEGELFFRPIESVLAKEKDLKNNHRFMLPPEAYAIPHVFRYHFHAISEDNSHDSGPSGYAPGTKGDLISCADETRYRGESHCVLVSKLSGSKVNVDYYTGEMMNGRVKIAVIDMGDYEY